MTYGAFHTWVQFVLTHKNVKDLQPVITKLSWVLGKVQWLKEILFVNEPVICKFLENLVPADTQGAHNKLLLLATVNLKGSEALVFPGGGLIINTTAKAFFTLQGVAGKTQVKGK